MRAGQNAVLQQVIISLMFALVALPAPAGLVPLAAPLPSHLSTAVGESRSVLIRNDSPISMNSLGIRMKPSLSSFSLTAEVFAWDASTNARGALLGSAIQGFTDAGFGFYDVAISQNLMPGFFYELNLKAFDLANFEVEFFDFDGATGAAAYSAGPVTIVDGCGDGNVGGCSNTVLANMRFMAGDATIFAAEPRISDEPVGPTAVPEPGSLALLGIGLFAFGVSRIRNKT